MFMVENKITISGESFKKFFADAESYFKSLNEMELAGWGLIGLGVILIILGIIFM
jgi:hypothetical protein